MYVLRLHDTCVYPILWMGGSSCLNFDFARNATRKCWHAFNGGMVGVLVGPERFMYLHTCIPFVVMFC
jgi:hypothetical protein